MPRMITRRAAEVTTGPIDVSASDSRAERAWQRAAEVAGIIALALLIGAGMVWHP